MALPPGDEGFAYSGSIVSAGDGVLHAFHTRHDPARGMQRQAVSRSADGRVWSVPAQILGRAEPNWRDPFVWARADGWRMLLARPGSWDTPTERAHLELWGSADLMAWQPLGTIGPFSPPGVLWEVPWVIERADGTASLVVSMVDRRAGRADSCVRYWPGRFDGANFERAHDEPLPLDLGPDFYAAIPAGGGADGGSILIGWLSNWQTARGFPCPGIAGGPASLPRSLALVKAGAEARLVQTTPPAIVAAFAAPTTAVPRAGLGLARLAPDFTLKISARDAALTVQRRNGQVRARREGSAILAWSAESPTDGNEVALFVDGPAIEIFLGGQTLNAALPDAGTAFRVELEGGAIDWRTLPSHHPTP